MERESFTWTMFLPHSLQAYKISCITNISPVKSCETYKISCIQMYISKGKKRKSHIPFFLFFFCLSLFLKVKTAQFDGCKILIFWILTPSNMALLVMVLVTGHGSGHWSALKSRIFFPPSCCIAGAPMCTSYRATNSSPLFSIWVFKLWHSFMRLDTARSSK